MVRIGKYRILFAVSAAVLIACGVAGNGNAEDRGDVENKQLLIHYRTGFDRDDNQACVAFNVALAALKKGYDVEFLFDASGVFDLQNGDPSAGANTAANTVTHPAGSPSTQPATQPATRPATQASTQPTTQPSKNDDPAPYRLRYELPEDLKEIIVKEFGVGRSEVPQNYYDYLKWLKSKGVVVTVNGVMAQLVSLASAPHSAEYLADVAKPINIDEMLDHFARADIVLVY